MDNQVSPYRARGELPPPPRARAGGGAPEGARP